MKKLTTMDAWILGVSTIISVGMIWIVLPMVDYDILKITLIKIMKFFFYMSAVIIIPMLLGHALYFVYKKLGE